MARLRFSHDNQHLFFDLTHNSLGELICDGIVFPLRRTQGGKLLSALMQAENYTLGPDDISNLWGKGALGSDEVSHPLGRFLRELRDAFGNSVDFSSLVSRTNTTVRLMPNGSWPEPAEEYHVAHARIPNEVHAEYKRLEQRGLNNLQTLLSEAAEIFPEDLGLFLERSQDGTPLPFHRVKLENGGRLPFPIPIDPGYRAPLQRDPKQIILKANPVTSLYSGRIIRLHNVSDTNWRMGQTRYFDLMEDCDWLKGALLRGWGEQEENTITRRNWLRVSPIVAEWRQRASAILRGDFSSYLAGIAFSLPILGQGKEGPEILLTKGSPQKQADAGKRHVCPAGMLEFSLPDESSSELTSEALKAYMRKELIEETMRRGVEDPDPFGIEARIQMLEGRVDTNGDGLGLTSLGPVCDQIIDLIRQENLSLPADDQCSLEAHDTLMEMDFEATPFELIVDALAMRPEIVLPIEIDTAVKASFNWECVEDGSVPSWKIGGDLKEIEKCLIGGMSDWAAPGLAAVIVTSERYLSRA